MGGAGGRGGPHLVRWVEGSKSVDSGWCLDTGKLSAHNKTELNGVWR